MKEIDRLIESLYNPTAIEIQLHFFWSFALSVIGHWIWPPFIFLGIIGTIVKELWDSKSNNQHSFSLKDIGYGLIGWSVAVLVLVF